jgi:glycosyltransferase involved in cell wall biosynthesis
MESGRDVLVLFTSHYPFGREAETFLDDELPVLARRFARVFVLPSRREDHVRPLPEGVVLDTTLADVSRDLGRRELLRRPHLALRQFLRALLEESRPQAYLRHPRTYFHLLGQDLLKCRVLRSVVVKHGLEDALFYDYWLTNSSLAVSWLRREGVVKRAVARAHHFDLYDERWETGAVPFRAFTLASLDRVFPISEHGLRYLSQRHPRACRKLLLSRLGVASPPPAALRCEGRHGGLPVVVSCARLVPFKRVERIPRILARIGTPLRWIHFGDGPSRHEVERAAAELPARVSWRLAGRVDHSQVLDYYRTNRVDLLISVSASEGLPVSMMEAISFGIPLLATAVGGVPEIVTSSTGTLVQPEDSAEVIAAAARRLLSGNGPPASEIRAYFESRFDAERNLGEFADLLHEL